MQKKLNLGSGNDYRDGYINVDNGLMYPDAKVDWPIDIKDFEMVEDDSVDEILLSHVVMYLRPEELDPLLKNWYDWLKKGGKLIIETIDIQKVCAYVDDEDLEYEYIEKFGLINIFGTEKTAPHRWGWFPESLANILNKSGFTQLQIKQGLKKPNRDFIIEATKI